MFPVNGSLRMAPLFPQSGPGESGSPTSQVLLRCYDFPSRLSGRLFASLPGSTRSSSFVSRILRSQKVGEPSGPGSVVQPATRSAGLLARGRERDLPGSQAIHPVPLPRSTTPAEPTIPRLFVGSIDAAPALPTAKASALMNFGAQSRGFGTRCLRFTNDVATTHAKLASGWLARLYREGVEPSGSQQKVSDHPSSFSGHWPGAKEVSRRSHNNLMEFTPA